MNLGEFVKEKREAKGISQRELGHLSNLSPMEISRIEGGIHKEPSIRILRNLSSGLGVDLLELLNVTSSQKV